MDMVQRDWLQGLRLSDLSPSEDSRAMVSDENVLSWTPVSLPESVRVETDPDKNTHERCFFTATSANNPLTSVADGLGRFCYCVVHSRHETPCYSFQMRSFQVSPCQLAHHTRHSSPRRRGDSQTKLIEETRRQANQKVTENHACPLSIYPFPIFLACHTALYKTKGKTKGK